MWATLHDNLLAGIALATALAGFAGAWLKLKPRRIVGWFSMALEREMLRQMLESEREWRTYWQTQATECIDQLRDGRR